MRLPETVPIPRMFTDFSRSIPELRQGHARRRGNRRAKDVAPAGLRGRQNVLCGNPSAPTPAELDGMHRPAFGFGRQGCARARRNSGTTDHSVGEDVSGCVYLEADSLCGFKARIHDIARGRGAVVGSPRARASEILVTLVCQRASQRLPDIE